MLKIRRPLGRLIFNMGIAIPGKTVFLIEPIPHVLFSACITHVYVIITTTMDGLHFTPCISELYSSHAHERDVGHNRKVNGIIVKSHEPHACMASLNADNSTVVVTLFCFPKLGQVNNTWNIKALHYRLFGKRIHQCPAYSLHKELVILTAFPWHSPPSYEPTYSELPDKMIYNPIWFSSLTACVIRARRMTNLT